ncbi:hypothetical protein PMKS-000557 [Pichia membranifaciens]|uniref:Uncharacterized protein n=1 Tax=Pichia membranifaciens TaxID=4926 RepID=A0A1Q2YC13_9ASCO|nr:hypothetical protein PMKS-000557 [Pichia membranifaciens]
MYMLLSQMESTKGDCVRNRDGKGESTLFRKELTLQESNHVHNNIKANQSVSFDIQQLAMKVDRVKKKSRFQDENADRLTLLLKSHIHRIQKKGHDGADVLKTLNQIREKSKQTRSNYGIDRYPASALRPTNWGSGGVSKDEGLSLTLQRIVEKARADTSHAIQKVDSVNTSTPQFLGVVKRVQMLSKSLKVLEVAPKSGEDEVRFKVGIVCLWNEWVEIRENDNIVFQDLNVPSHGDEMQWSFKWKKMVGS